jgi:hypothetical protein
MVKYFHFHYTDAGGRLRKFDKTLKSMRCIHRIPGTGRCLKRCLIGLKECWMHLEKNRTLKIRESGHLQNLGHTGKGLYAYHRNTNRVVLFKKGETICKYNGERINTRELRKRYGRYTAPYGIKVGNKYEDAALQRGVGSLVNHAIRGTNCSLVHDDDANVLLEADTDIKNGDELLTSYGKKYRFDEPVQTSTNSKKKSV